MQRQVVAHGARANMMLNDFQTDNTCEVSIRTFKLCCLGSLMFAGANLELSYIELAPHANDRMTAALELAKHAKETQRHLRFTSITASTSGIKHLAEESAGYITFSLIH